MRSALAADLDREQSLTAMWHALRASNFAGRNRVEIDAGVVHALLNARYYESARGQFISQDPVFWSNRQNLSNPQSLNSYSYAEDNPTTKKDPDGLAASNSAIVAIYQQLVSILQSYISILSGSGGGSSGSQSKTSATNNTTPGLVLGADVVMPMRTQTWSPSNDKKISGLDPRVRQPATNFINETEDWQGVKLLVTGGYRSAERQDALYKQGRSTPGQIVTRAKGGESPHNYGMAIDVVPTNGGQPDWNTPISSQIAAIGKNQGFEWGGDWKGGFIDSPHFEMTFGQSFKDYRHEEKATTYFNTGCSCGCWFSCFFGHHYKPNVLQNTFTN